MSAFDDSHGNPLPLNHEQALAEVERLKELAWSLVQKADARAVLAERMAKALEHWIDSGGGSKDAAEALAEWRKQ